MVNRLWEFKKSISAIALILCIRAAPTIHLTVEENYFCMIISFIFCFHNISSDELGDGYKYPYSVLCTDFVDRCDLPHVSPYILLMNWWGYVLPLHQTPDIAGVSESNGSPSPHQFTNYLIIYYLLIKSCG